MADRVDVTLPRRICAGETCMEQKRCYGQEFRLVPHREVVHIIEYALGYCAAKYEIDLHEFTVMSNHDHVENTDNHANRPAFYQLFHSMVARAVNSLYGDTDALWSTQRYSAPVLLDADSRLERALYVLLNPVAAGLVRYVWDWEGVTSWSMEYDRPKIVKRPEHFFSKNMPEQVELVIRRPPDVRPDLDNRRLRAWIRQEVKKRQGDIAARIKREGGRFLGMRRVLRQPRRARPMDRPIRAGIRPTVAGASKWTRMERLQARRQFLDDHETARLRRKSGDYTAIYPYGTYLARVRDGAPCHGPSP